MKKILLIVLTTIMVFAFAGCGGGPGDGADKVVGTWIDEYELVQIEFLEDGTGTETMLGMPFDIEWTISGSEVTVEDGVEPRIFVLDGETLTYEDDVFMKVSE